MGNRVQRVKTDISEPQMAQALIAAWTRLFGRAPSRQQVAMVIAQNNLETGHRHSMWNYNVGNITTDGTGPFDYFDDLTTDEQVKPGEWKKMNLKYRAYPTLDAGVEDYLKLISRGRYAEAWKHVMDPDPVAYSKALKSAGYYTADEAAYTKAMQSLYNESNKSDSYDLAMSGKVKPPTGSAPATTRPSAPPSEVASLEQVLDNFVHMLAAAATDPTMKRLYKKALPNQDILIKITAPDYTSAVEFSRVLCSVLDEDLLSTSYTYTDGQDVEVECSIPGPATECFATVEQMTQAVAETFQNATAKIGGISIKAECIINKKSSYQPISLRTAGANYRKFLLKFV